MTSIAYPVKPPHPGWIATIGALLVGWLVAGAATAVLSIAAGVLGAIGQPYPSSKPGAINDWPYPANGLWSLAANVAVILLVLVLTTMSTSWWMRRYYDELSEGRLAFVLLVTGWLPLRTGGPIGGFSGFLVAVVLIRFWVSRHQDHLPVRTAIVVVVALAAVISSYGLLHPLWTSDVEQAVFSPRPHEAMIVVHNAARVPVRVDGFEVTPSFGRPRGFAPEIGLQSTPARSFRFAAGSERFLFQPLPPGGCGTVRVAIHLRYHLLGLPLTQTVPADISLDPLGRHC